MRVRRAPLVLPLAIAGTLLLAIPFTRGCARDSAPPTPGGASPASAAESELVHQRAAEAVRFLSSEMDRWTDGTHVYDDFDSGGAGFYPNLTGDLGDIAFDDRHTIAPAEGHSCIRVRYTPRGPLGWAGILWTYPDRNFGATGGRTLAGANQLSFMAKGAKGGEIVEVSIGGVNRPPHRDPANPMEDTLGAIRKTIALTDRWQHYHIDVVPEPGDSLQGVIGGFAITFNRAAVRDTEVFLDSIKYDNADPNLLRLVRSYVPTADPADDPIRNAVFVYDTAVTGLCYLAQRTADGDRRARLLADALVWAQTHDRSGRNEVWRNAYACGPLADPATNLARLPGVWDTKSARLMEDRYAISRGDTGNICWIIIFLVSAHDRLEAPQNADPKYLRSAHRASHWILKHCRADARAGGFTGGYEGWDNDAAPEEVRAKRLVWRSAEHNIDAYVAFRKLGVSLKRAGIATDIDWNAQACHARDFVLQKTWNAKGGFFWAGTRDLTDAPNESAIPGDGQNWAVIAMGHDPEFRRTIGWSGPPSVPAPIRWLESNCRTQVAGHTGYLFSNKGSGIWPEASGHTAATYHYLGDHAKAVRILAEVARLPQQPSADGIGGLDAAFPVVADTGFIKEFYPRIVGPWTYPAKRHAGASAWFAASTFAASPAGASVYWLDGPPRD